MRRRVLQRFAVAFAAALGEGFAGELDGHASEAPAATEEGAQLFQHIFIIRQHADFFARKAQPERAEAQLFEAVRQGNNFQIAAPRKRERADFGQSQAGGNRAQAHAAAEGIPPHRAETARQIQL